MNAFDRQSNCDREDLASALLHHLATASDHAGAENDAAAVAAANRLRLWVERARAESRNSRGVARSGLFAFVRGISRTERIFGALRLRHGARVRALMRRRWSATKRRVSSSIAVSVRRRPCSILARSATCSKIAFSATCPLSAPARVYRLSSGIRFKLQLTATRNGGFFRRHDDNSHAANRTRHVRVLFFLRLVAAGRGRASFLADGALARPPPI